MESVIILLMFVSIAFLFLAIAELLALIGIGFAIQVMNWYDDYTCWRYLQRKRRFWKKIVKDGKFHGN